MGRLLREAGLLTTLDTTALAAYCTAYARHMEAESMLQGPPGIPFTGNGLTEGIVGWCEGVGLVALLAIYLVLVEYTSRT